MLKVAPNQKLQAHRVALRLHHLQRLLLRRAHPPGKLLNAGVPSEVTLPTGGELKVTPLA